MAAPTAATPLGDSKTAESTLPIHNAPVTSSIDTAAESHKIEEKSAIDSAPVVPTTGASPLDTAAVSLPVASTVGSLAPDAAPVAPTTGTLPPTSGTLPPTTHAVPAVAAADATATHAPAHHEHHQVQAKPIEADGHHREGEIGYKAPGLINHFKFSKRYFWLGDAPVTTQQLTNYLRGTEAKIAHHVAAWSSQTGKGLLYIAKHQTDKEQPHDVLLIAEATDLQKQHPHEFHFKIDGDKHSFKAKNDHERDLIYAELAKAITESESTKAEITSRQGYHDSLKHLGSTAVAGGVAGGVAAKVTEEVKHKKNKHSRPGRSTSVGSSSSSSSSVGSDKAGKKLRKHKNKTSSRSASGKRKSFFGALLGKTEKPETEETIHHSTEGVTESVAHGHHGHAAHATEAVEVAPITGTALANDIPSTDATQQSIGAPIVGEQTLATSTDAAVSPKPQSKRFSFFQRSNSPTTGKKDIEIAPPVPAKDESVAPLLVAGAAGAAVAGDHHHHHHDKQHHGVGHLNEHAAEGEHAKVDHHHEHAKAEHHATETAHHLGKHQERKVEEAALATDLHHHGKAHNEKHVEHKKEGGFLSNLLNKARSKSPAAYSAPEVPPKDESTLGHSTVPQTSTAVDSSVTAPLAEPAKIDTSAPLTTEPTTTSDIVNSEDKALSPTASKRRSLFASFAGPKREGEGGSDNPLDKLGAIFRRPSQATRALSEKNKENVAPTTTQPAVIPEVSNASVIPTETAAPAMEKVEETAVPTTEATIVPATSTLKTTV